MTVAEFLAWDAGDGRLWQLVDGQPQAMAPAGRHISHSSSDHDRTLHNTVNSKVRIPTRCMLSATWSVTL